MARPFWSSARYIPWYLSHRRIPDRGSSSRIDVICGPATRSQESHTLLQTAKKPQNQSVQDKHLANCSLDTESWIPLEHLRVPRGAQTHTLRSMCKVCSSQTLHITTSLQHVKTWALLSYKATELPVEHFSCATCVWKGSTVCGEEGWNGAWPCVIE